MSSFLYSKRGFHYLCLWLILVSCIAEEPEEVKECEYTTYNTLSASYSCAAGSIPVGNKFCCPDTHPYHCPYTGKCHTSCEGQAQSGCPEIVFSTSTGGGCSTPYKGPTADVQSAVFCQAAWNHRCYGETAKADANCKIYKQMQSDNPGLPNCPYC